MTAPHLAPGHIVAGKYTVRGELGRGPISVTYSAITAPNREVAIRIYDPAIPSVTASVERLRGMCAAMTALPSRWIVPILDLGFDPELGAPYSATLQVTAPSLAQLVELCPLEPAEIPAFVIGLARAIDALHGAGIAHLGLTPTNVFVGPAPERVVQLTDAGVHGIFTGARLGGSLAWLAPEQTADPSASGPPADVFAAALLVFHALTGHPLLRTTAQAAIDHRAWRDEIAARPSASARARELGVELPALVDAPFRRAIALSPSERFATASEFAASLAEALAPGSALRLMPDHGVPPPPPIAYVAPAPAFAQRHAPAIAIEPPPWVAPVESAPAVEVAAARLNKPLVSPPLPEIALPVEIAPAIDVQPAVFQSAPVFDAAPPMLGIAPKVDRLLRSRRALFLVAGAFGLFVVVGSTLAALSVGSRRKEKPAATVSRATASAIASAAVVPATEASPPALPSPVVVAPTPATPTTSALPPASSAVVEHNRGELLVECDPVTCTTIALDGKVSSGPGPFVVRPGFHGVGVSRPGYGGQWKRVEVPEGGQTTVRFTLTPALPPKKACGKFLERCN